MFPKTLEETQKIKNNDDSIFLRRKISLNPEVKVPTKLQRGSISTIDNTMLILIFDITEDIIRLCSPKPFRRVNPEQIPK